MFAQSYFGGEAESKIPGANIFKLSAGSPPRAQPRHGMRNAQREMWNAERRMLNAGC